MIPVYFFFRKTDINAVNSPFLQILLHGLRTSNKAKQEVAGVVVAFLDSHSQQFLQREIAALRETLPKGAPGIFHQLFRTYADDLFQIHGALVHPLQDGQGQHEFDDALHGIGRLIPHHDGFPRIQHFRSHAHTGLQGMGQFAHGGGIRCGNGRRRRRGPLRKNAKEHDATA